MRILRLLLVLPLLVGMYAVANSIGVTDTVSKATGIDIPDEITIPGLDQVLDTREEISEAARTAAVKMLRREVRERFGPEVAQAVPSDLTAAEAKRIVRALRNGADRDRITDLLNRTGKQPGNGQGEKDERPGNGGGGSGGSGETMPVNGSPAMYDRARRQIEALDVKGRAPMTGYDRDEFGSEWSDSAGDFGWTGNGCDTRNDVLRRDLVDVTFESGSSCEVDTGTLRYERYTGQRDYRFDAGDDEYDTDLDIEHVVALGNGWVTGAAGWSVATRAAFANDPLNLFAADPSSNRQKGDADAATWLPSNKAYRCAYVSQQAKVKTKYDLWVTEAEKAAMVGVLDGCRS